MPARSATPRPLRRLRRALALLATVTALLIAAACRLETVGRAAAAIGALACLAVWVVVLELDGRASDRLDGRGPRRAAARRTRRVGRREDASRRAA